LRVLAPGTIVMTDVPPNTMVAGNPARQFRKLEAPQTSKAQETSRYHDGNDIRSTS
jgi:acetyltransferase-like isoleucine patch superfamily enzyme